MFIKLIGVMRASVAAAAKLVAANDADAGVWQLSNRAANMDVFDIAQDANQESTAVGMHAIAAARAGLLAQLFRHQH